MDPFPPAVSVFAHTHTHPPPAGSFLSYAGLGAFAQVINVRHKFLDRTALLLQASTLSPRFHLGEAAVFERFGIR